MARRAVLFSGAHQTALDLENVRIRVVGMMSTLKPLCGAFMIACGALGLLVLSVDWPPVRRARRRLSVWWARRRGR